MLIMHERTVDGRRRLAVGSLIIVLTRGCKRGCVRVGYSSRLSRTVLVGMEGGLPQARGLACVGAMRQRLGLTC